MFIRRLYYNSQGEVLHSYMMSGDLKPISTWDEAARLGLEGWNVKEWYEPDPEVEQNFIDSHGRVSVDMESGELVFDFSPLPVEETEADDMKNALSILGVEVESNG